MKHRSLYGLIFALCSAFCSGQTAFADLTMRHTIEFKFGSFLPAAAVDAMKGQLAEQIPKESLIQIKGQKIYLSMGRIAMLADYSKSTITLLDPKGKRFATSPLSEYADKIAAVQTTNMAGMPEQVKQLFANIQVDVKSDRTGKTAVIQGIHADDNLMTISITIPNPAGPPMQMRMEMHRWLATPEEIERVPALKELELYASLPKMGVDASEMMTKAFAGFPGMADKLRGAMADISKSSSKATLRIETAVFMPSMAAMMPGAGDQALTEYTMNLAELSTATLPDSRFEVPAEYQAAPMEDLITSMFPAPKLAAPQAPAAEAPKARAPEPLPAGVQRVGNGVTPPALVTKTEPSYTEEARAARIQGTVLLSVVVGEDGVARQMKVLRSLDPGLDQKAMETVAKWKFKPGTKDGKPVAVQAQIEVNFRLM